MSYLVSSNKISHRLRDDIYHKAYKDEIIYDWWWNKLYQLITCPYCLAFWLSLFTTFNIIESFAIAFISLVLNSVL